jgi:hypothetical protein
LNTSLVILVQCGPVVGNRLLTKFRKQISCVRFGKYFCRFLLDISTYSIEKLDVKEAV